jgi:hypothetical protein
MFLKGIESNLTSLNYLMDWKEHGEGFILGSCRGLVYWHRRFHTTHCFFEAAARGGAGTPFHQSPSRITRVGSWLILPYEGLYFYGDVV